MTAYVTADEIKAAMPDVIGSTTYHAILGTLATRASQLIDTLLGYDHGAFDAPDTATARYYDGDGGNALYIDPCVEVSTVSVKENETATDYTDWDASDWNAAAGSKDYPDWNAGYYTVILVAPGVSKTFTRGQKTVKVTAKWGRTASPPEIIKQAVIIQAARWFKRGQQAFQDTSASAELGMLQYTKQLDPDVAAILKASGYRRVR